MPSSDLALVRSFYRALTLRVGAFSESFLGRGRPLAQARLMFEIGPRGADVSDLRTWMNLDAGYLSRLLRAVKKDGLIEIVPLPTDLRSHRVTLTEAGLAELEALNHLGDRFAAETIAPLNYDQRRRLISAMAETERLLNLAFAQITREDPDNAHARYCLEKFAAELCTRFDQEFDPARSLPAGRDDLVPPRGVFLLARLDGRPVGCGAISLLEPGIATVKRMWVAPEVRGVGLGHRLLTLLEQEAGSLGVTLLRLETNRNLHEAQALYRRNGYREVPAFNAEPYAHFWFEKLLAATEPAR